jgi:hypothetical protein
MRAAILLLAFGATIAHAQESETRAGGAREGEAREALPSEGGREGPPLIDPDVPTVGASLDHNEAYVGDRLALTITAIARAGINVSLPQKLDLGKLELLERDDAEAKGRDLGDGKRAYRFLLYVAAYDVGPTEVPPVTVSYLSARGEVRSVTTSPLSLSIKALVDGEQTPDPQPARPPRFGLIEDRRVILGVAVAGGVVVLLLAILIARRLWRRRKRRISMVSGPLVPTRPAGEVAIERLQQIRARGLFERDGYRPFAFDTAEVVRAYLGARYGFDSLELTSTELLDELRRAAPHLAESGSEVVRFLERTDLIKFAKTGATPAEAIDLLDSAQAIVLSTAPRLEVAAEMLAGPVRPPSPSSSARGGD